MKAVVMVAVAAVVAIAAAPASADRLAFVRDNNVWLANADGTGH